MFQKFNFKLIYNIMKLSQWAKLNGIHYNTAYRWFHKGTLPVSAYQLDTGTIIVEESKTSIENIENKIVIYARVSSHNKKDDLQRQADRCVEFCNAKGLEIEKIYKEIASGTNDNRPQFWKMINSNPTHIIVEHKDRLTRFGFNYLEQLLGKINCKLIVMNRDAEDETDLIKDMISIITSYCCRLYGIRRGQNKTNIIKKILMEENA